MDVLSHGTSVLPPASSVSRCKPYSEEDSLSRGISVLFKVRYSMVYWCTAVECNVPVRSAATPTDIKYFDGALKT